MYTVSASLCFISMWLFHTCFVNSWWRYNMEMLSMLLALCERNPPDVFFDICLNIRLNKECNCWWYETPWPSFDVTEMSWALFITECSEIILQDLELINMVLIDQNGNNTYGFCIRTTSAYLAYCLSWFVHGTDWYAYYHTSAVFNTLRPRQNCRPWWRHQMKTFTGPLCGEFTGEFPSQRPVTRIFDVSFDLRLNKQLSKQLWGWWFETSLGPSLRHCNAFRRRHFQMHFLEWKCMNSLKISLNLFLWFE